MGTFHRLKKEVGNAVLAKYQHQCTNCGSKENLCVHHVIKMKPDDENWQHGKSLCKKHYEYRRKRGLI